MANETESQNLRIAVEGCGHGTLDAIYASVEKSCQIRGWSGVDLLIICGDFQAVRTQADLNVTAMPAKYRKMGDFHQYYYGQKIAPYLTVFIGGNHEASNHLFELYYGGWAAPNIYYLGAANVVKLGPLKIASVSGIFHRHDYGKQHFERLPYNSSTMRSVYHQRELDVRKLLAYRSQVDIGISHDWPKDIEWLGDYHTLFKHKSFFLGDALKGELGSPAVSEVLDRLRPPHWFSAHMHYRYTAFKDFDTFEQTQVQNARSQYASTRSASRHNGERKPNSITTQPSKSNISEENGSVDRSLREIPYNPAISGWTNFSNTIEAQEAALKEQEQEQHREEANERSTSAHYTLEETYIPVSVSHIDGLQMRQGSAQQSQPQGSNKLPQYDGTCFSAPKRRRSSSDDDDARPLIEPQAERGTDPTIALPATVTNPDAIDIDMSDSDDAENTKPILSKAKDPVLSEPDATSEISGEPPAGESNHVNLAQHAGLTHDDPSPAQASVNNDPANNDEEISESLRQELADLSANFAPEAKMEKTADLPFPVETITNKKTRFLALSKVEKDHDRDFLQLLEIQPINQNSEADFVRPVKLQYDPEWLAILRAFASELELGGDFRSRATANRGDTYYRDAIIEEEKWIQENVVEKNRLEIPQNFVITTNSTGQWDRNSNKMPREQTNPQTTQFCELIGIDNKFDFSEEDRDARVAAGPPPDRPHHSNRGGRGNHRGGMRGRGRGGDRGGRRGR